MRAWLFALITITLSSVAPQGLGQEKPLVLPPESLANWYKPVNARQVWLHTMFSLRREMQAVSEYVAREDRVRLVKWAERLVDHYRKIGKMVPEWNDELELEWADKLVLAAEQGDYSGVARAQRKISRSCRSCHRESRALAAAIYRTPDYSSLTVRNSKTLRVESFDDAMERLSTLVNRIKIAGEDGEQDLALASLDDLNGRLSDLQAVCSDCHHDQYPAERILGMAGRELIQRLKEELERADQKAADKTLGSLAVKVCARCHGIHRTLYDLKRVIHH